MRDIDPENPKIHVDSSQRKDSQKMHPFLIQNKTTDNNFRSFFGL
jgi:hypothetical protein